MQAVGGAPPVLPDGLSPPCDEAELYQLVKEVLVSVTNAALTGMEKQPAEVAAATDDEALLLLEENAVVLSVHSSHSAAGEPAAAASAPAEAGTCPSPSRVPGCRTSAQQVPLLRPGQGEAEAEPDNAVPPGGGRSRKAAVHVPYSQREIYEKKRTGSASAWGPAPAPRTPSSARRTSPVATPAARPAAGSSSTSSASTARPASHVSPGSGGHKGLPRAGSARPAPAASTPPKQLGKARSIGASPPAAPGRTSPSGMVRPPGTASPPGQQLAAKPPAGAAPSPSLPSPPAPAAGHKPSAAGRGSSEQRLVGGSSADGDGTLFAAEAVAEPCSPEPAGCRNLGPCEAEGRQGSAAELAGPVAGAAGPSACSGAVDGSGLTAAAAASQDQDHPAAGANGVEAAAGAPQEAPRVALAEPAAPPPPGEDSAAAAAMQREVQQQGGPKPACCTIM